MICNDCKTPDKKCCNRCGNNSTCERVIPCGEYGCPLWRPPTNYQHIKSMSIDELAVFLRSVENVEINYNQRDCASCIPAGDNDCYKCMKSWLESEVSDNDATKE